MKSRRRKQKNKENKIKIKGIRKEIQIKDN